MGAVVEGTSKHPTVGLYNFCQAWNTLPVPLSEMPGKLACAFVIIFNVRDSKRQAVAEAEIERNRNGI